MSGKGFALLLAFQVPSLSLPFTMRGGEGGGSASESETEGMGHTRWCHSGDGWGRGHLRCVDSQGWLLLLPLLSRRLP